MDRIYEEIQQKKEHAERDARFYGDVLTELTGIRKQLEETRCKHDLEAHQDPITGRVSVRCLRKCGLEFSYAGFGRM